MTKGGSVGVAAGRAEAPGLPGGGREAAAPAPRWVAKRAGCDGSASSVAEGVDTGSELPMVPIWKRFLDVAGILLSLPVTLPLGLAIMIWVQLVSPGPVFFRQARVGRGGKVFTLLKFRSMMVDAPTLDHERYLEKLIRSDAPMTKLDKESDPRIIRGGRCLRATGLDELPQLINVMRGEMSLVGPRPSTPHEHALLTSEQQTRVAALPGLTGYWQVSGKNKLTLQQMIALDRQYIATMSLGMDLAIVVATLPAMLLQFMESRAVAPATPRAAESDGVSKPGPVRAPFSA